MHYIIYIDNQKKQDKRNIKAKVKAYEIVQKYTQKMEEWKKTAPDLLKVSGW